MGRVAKNRSGSLLRGGARRGPEGGCPKAPAEGGGRGWGVRLDRISDSNSDWISDWISDYCGTVSSTWMAQGRGSGPGRRSRTGALERGISNSDSNSDWISDWISDHCGTVSSPWMAQGRGSGPGRRSGTGALERGRGGRVDRAARGGVPELELWNEGTARWAALGLGNEEGT